MGARSTICSTVCRCIRDCHLPSAGLTKRKKAQLRLLPPGAGSRRAPRRYQPTPRRGKRLAGSPNSLPNRVQPFPSLWRQTPWIRPEMNTLPGTCLPGWPDPLDKTATPIHKVGRSIATALAHPGHHQVQPYPSHEQIRENVKRSGAVTELERPIQKLSCCTSVGHGCGGGCGGCGGWC